MGLVIFRLFFVLSIALAVQLSLASQPLKVVTDHWPPFAYVENNQVVGSDVEIIKAVFSNMGIKINIKMMPWKRSLSLMSEMKADAILDVSKTIKRQEYLYFPDEAISQGSVVLFKNKDISLPSVTLDNSNALTVGAIVGYKYCDKLDQSALIKNAYRVSALSQNLRMLISGRIDLMVAVDTVGLYEAERMGVTNRIQVVPDSHYCSENNYLAFAKDESNQALASRFSHELAVFKKTHQYQSIMKKYSMNTE